MPSRNIIKQDMQQSYYHVYARGASKERIFLCEADYQYFTQLFKRYLSDKVVVGKTGAAYPRYQDQIELLAFCLMSNHFHLLVYQVEEGYMALLLKSIMSSYGRYFNLKYHRSGSLWESTYKAVRIDADSYLDHISRYIHLNPRYWLRYPHSSVRYYLHEQPPEWLRTKRVLGLFKDRHEYEQFLREYESRRDMLKDMEYDLAND